jgi:ketosteroid isomerase-like protein
MVATERAFAAATGELGVRDGFLAFFADDAVSLQPAADSSGGTVALARAGLLAQPPAPLPLTTRLTWAPVTGQVSADGTLGWLTGGYVNHNLQNGTVIAQGAYFSVWLRRDDGAWRVWLDHGVALPRAWDETAFTESPEPDSGVAGAPGEPLDVAERAAEADDGAWRARLAAGVRLHRDGEMPIVGRDAVAAWARARSPVRWTVLSTRVASSSDLAVALGGYVSTSPSGSERGTWARVWRRDAGARWRIVFETSKPAR